MSVQQMLQAAVKAAIEAHAPTAEALTAVFDAPPVRAARPYALIEDAVLADWGTKDMAGREGRFAVVVHDGGERPDRLRALAGGVEAAVPAMAREIGEGWRIASLAFLRSRIARESGERWTALIEFRVRMLRES